MARAVSVRAHGRKPAHWSQACSAAALAFGGCAGPQSSLDPSGDEAGRVAELFWLMCAGGAAILALVLGIALYATYGKSRPHGERFAHGFVVVAGILLPILVLAGLLVHGLSLMVRARAPADPGLRIAVSGEEFWFRVAYERPGQGPVESANEIRLPVGRRVELALTSPDVIHSFWLPALAGKMDMIPGRTNRLVIEATRPGTFRGACAEFCGSSHALMAFTAVAMEPADYEAWLAREAAPAAARDAAAFLRNGCGACHAVRGTEAVSQVGPDLTHLAARPTIGAGLMANTPENLRRFVAEVDRLKPGARMPGFRMLPAGELDAIVAYLGRLR